MYKRGTPEYDLWRKSPEYDLYCKRISVTMTGKRHSTETLAKMRTAKLGKRFSAETRAKISASKTGERHPMYGRHRSIKTKRKISVSLKGRLDLCGPNNPNWRGGASFAPYSMEWTVHLREAIRKRDNYTCVLCGKAQSKRCYNVHHIDYDKQSVCPENLVTLCIGCHLKTNHEREYWENLFIMVYVPEFPKRRKNEPCC